MEQNHVQLSAYCHTQVDCQQSVCVGCQPSIDAVSDGRSAAGAVVTDDRQTDRHRYCFKLC